MTAAAFAAPSRPVWIRAYGSVVAPPPADCHHVCQLSLAAGVRGLGDGVTMIGAAAVALLVVSLTLVGGWWWRRAGQVPVATRRDRATSPDALDSVRLHLRREFATVAGIAAALPPDTPLAVEVPLLADQIGIAAHGTDRLLDAVRHARVDARAAQACVERARRVAAAVIGLHSALVAATREPGPGLATRAVAQAVDELDAAVDGLYIEVTTLAPPWAPGEG